MTNNKTDTYSRLPKVRQISNLSFFVILKYNTIQTDFSLVYDWNTSETLELNNPSIKNDYAEGRISEGADSLEGRWEMKGWEVGDGVMGGGREGGGRKGGGKWERRKWEKILFPCKKNVDVDFMSMFLFAFD